MLRKHRILYIVWFAGLFFAFFWFFYRSKNLNSKGLRRVLTAIKMAVIAAIVWVATLSSSFAKTDDPFFGVHGLQPSTSRFWPRKSGQCGKPPSAGRPNPFRPRVNPYRPAPNLVDQGVGAAANPAGAGNGDGDAQFGDSCPVPKTGKNLDQFQNPNSLNQPRKKKKKQWQKDEKYGGFDYKIDKNGNPIIKVTSRDGYEIFLTYDKSLEKYYHQDVYRLKKPKDFNSTHARSLKPKDRLEYLRKTVPRDKVIEFQVANAKSLTTEIFRPVPGFIGPKKEPGTLFINKKTGQIHFVNDRTGMWRTTVIKTKTGLINLAKNDFHLFPDAVN